MLHDAMRRTSILVLLALPALAADPLVPREPFAKAHVSLMARAQAGSRGARLGGIDVWGEGTRLRARVRGEPHAGPVSVGWPAAEALRTLGRQLAQVRP